MRVRTRDSRGRFYGEAKTLDISNQCCILEGHTDQDLKLQRPLRLQLCPRELSLRQPKMPGYNCKFLFLMCIISANVLSLTSYIRSRSVTPFDRMLSLQHGLHFPL